MKPEVRFKSIGNQGFEKSISNWNIVILTLNSILSGKGVFLKTKTNKNYSFREIVTLDSAESDVTQ